MIIRKPVENFKSKISKNITKFVPNTSESNISDGVKTKELDKSYTSSIASCSTEIYSIDTNKGLKPKDSSGEANSNLCAKSSHLKFPSQLQTAEQVESSVQAPLLRVPNRLNPVHASPHGTPDPVQIGLPLMRVPQHVTASAEAGDDVISLMPEGKINIISDLLEDFDKFYAPHIVGGGDNNIFNKNIVQPYLM